MLRAVGVLVVCVLVVQAESGHIAEKRHSRYTRHSESESESESSRRTCTDADCQTWYGVGSSCSTHFTCKCNAGYQYANGKCIQQSCDVDQCHVQHGTDSECVHTLNGHSCACSDGFYMNGTNYCVAGLDLDDSCDSGDLGDRQCDAVNNGAFCHTVDFRCACAYGFEDNGEPYGECYTRTEVYIACTADSDCIGAMTCNDGTCGCGNGNGLQFADGYSGTLSCAAAPEIGQNCSMFSIDPCPSATTYSFCNASAHCDCQHGYFDDNDPGLGCRHPNDAVASSSSSESSSSSSESGETAPETAETAHSSSESGETAETAHSSSESGETAETAHSSSSSSESGETARETAETAHSSSESAHSSSSSSESEETDEVAPSERYYYPRPSETAGRPYYGESAYYRNRYVG